MTRLKRFYLSESLFIRLFNVGEIHVKCIQGLPEDAKFVRWFQTNGRIEVVVSSDEWPELLDGDIIPEIELLFEKLT